MKIYISGISGTGMGPLALMAKKAGIDVYGSDLSKGAIYQELVDAGIEIFIGEQDGKFLESKIKDGVEWFVHTSALPEDAPELLVAKKAGIRISKRDNLTEFLVQKLGLKMVAVAGTHGKTTTTSMIVWACLQLELPVAYIVGTTLGFAPSGSYKEGDKYFIYEADEYDRNFLKFHPWLSVITSVSYDHPDIYKTPEEYREAFRQFEGQSEMVIKGDGDLMFKDVYHELAGEARRYDAVLAANAVWEICLDDSNTTNGDLIDPITPPLWDFPGVGRRFEKLADGIYTDYAHHPEEIKATMDVALDQMDIDSKKGVVVVYQPHQNTRQHEVQDLYYDAFIGAEKVFWLPTYLTREDESLPILKPMDFISGLNNAEVAEPADLNDELWREIKKYRDDGYLVVLMTAGPADTWLRQKINDFD
ncbi:MAG: Mur ligase domain-containing protein [Candidatus Saccharibacteria bacterium]|nr:Mur ligase domain-containing protein [Candidatus Saccharibacteria bacterium]